MVENRDSVLHFHEYFRVIRNRLWVIFTIFILTVFSGAYVTEEVFPKIYTSSAQVEIKKEGRSFIKGVNVDPDRGFDPTDFQADFEIMQSPTVLQPVITELNLDKVWAARAKSSAPLTPLQAMGYMSNILRLDVKRGTDIIVITASSEVPKEAADIANEVANQYKSMRDSEQDKRNSIGVDAVQEQIDQQQKIVDDKKALVDKLFQEAGAKNIHIVPKGNAEKAETDLEKSKQDLLQAQEDADKRRVLLEQVQNLNDDDFVNTLSAMGREESNIATLRSDVFRIEGDRDNLLKDGFEENHPRVLALGAEIDRKKAQIKDLIAGTRRAMAVDVQMAQSSVTILQKAVDDLSAKIQQDQSTSLEPYYQAQHDLEQQQEILEAYDLRLKQVKADKVILESPVTIISKAEPADTPSSPNKKLFYTISTVGGIFVGIMVAFLIEYLDTSVKTMADAESLLGLPVLTVIPNKGGPMPLIQESARLPHAEGYRILRAKLDLKVQNGVGPSLSMLSGGPGEGKSTTIYNLAVVCAQAGQSVILVDCDLRRPTVHSLTNLSNDRGLANYLRGEGDAVEYIQQTAIPKLHILASGDMPMSEIGVLAGDKIRAMLEDLKQRYDLVLVDSPPVLGISDGSIIAREVDYVILVIQHRRYPREISLRAKRAIEEVHGNCVGMVLNCVSVKSDDSYYYYSNYGNYYKKVDRAKKGKNVLKEHANGKPVSASSRKKDLDSDEF